MNRKKWRNNDNSKWGLSFDLIGRLERDGFLIKSRALRLSVSGGGHQVNTADCDSGMKLDAAQVVAACH